MFSVACLTPPATRWPRGPARRPPRSALPSRPPGPAGSRRCAARCWCSSRRSRRRRTCPAPGAAQVEGGKKQAADQDSLNGRHAGESGGCSAGVALLAQQAQQASSQPSNLHASAGALLPPAHLRLQGAAGARVLQAQPLALPPLAPFLWAGGQGRGGIASCCCARSAPAGREMGSHLPPNHTFRPAALPPLLPQPGPGPPPSHLAPARLEQGHDVVVLHPGGRLLAGDPSKLARPLQAAGRAAGGGDSEGGRAGDGRWVWYRAAAAGTALYREGSRWPCKQRCGAFPAHLAAAELITLRLVRPLAGAAGGVGVEVGGSGLAPGLARALLLLALPLLQLLFLACAAAVASLPLLLAAAAQGGSGGVVAPAPAGRRLGALPAVEPHAELAIALQAARIPIQSGALVAPRCEEQAGAAAAPGRAGDLRRQRRCGARSGAGIRA